MSLRKFNRFHCEKCGASILVVPGTSKTSVVCATCGVWMIWKEKGEKKMVDGHGGSPYQVPSSEVNPA